MTEKQADKIIWEQREVPLSALKPNERNPRTITRQQFAKLKESLTETGYHARLTCDPKLNLIGGHMRLKAMQELGFTHALVLVPSRDLTDEERQRVSIQDNIAFGEWDVDILASDFNLEDLQSWGLDENSLNFALPSTTEGFTDPDATPTAPPIPITLYGDLWRLGNHRIMCGDSTKEKDVEKLMSGNNATMCFTDPPWNVAIGLDSNPRHRQRKGLKNDNLSAKDFTSFLMSFASLMLKYVTGDIYVVLGASEWPTLDLALRETGFHWSATIIWVKDLFVLGRSKYHRRYEPIWYGWSNKSSFGEARDKDDVWEINRPRVSEEHPTMKPVELVRRAIENSSKPGDKIYEPFSGGGSAIIAAEMMGRECYAMEIEPQYCDVAITRWQNFTKKDAIHMKTGKTFNEAMAIKNAAMKATGR